MAKVEIEIPDDLLRRIDRVADRMGESRDEFLQRVTESEVDRCSMQWRKELEQMMGPPIHGGGESERWIREDRDHHDDQRLGCADDDR